MASVFYRRFETEQKSAVGHQGVGAKLQKGGPGDICPGKVLQDKPEKSLAAVQGDPQHREEEVAE